MARYYNTSQGQNIDFTYKPDKQLHLAVAEQEVALDKAKKDLQSK